MTMDNDDIHLGARVFLRCADDKRPGMITGILTEPTGTQIRVMWGHNASASWHYAFELSTT